MIYLREITENDLEVINKYRQDKELIAFLGEPFRYINIESDKKWFETYIGNRNNNVRCAICLSENNRIIGMAYLIGINWVNRNAEFAICIAENNYRGIGIGKQAALEILRNGFYDLNLNRIELTVLEENTRAIKLYKNLGFKEEGLLRKAIFKNNKYSNKIIMGILKDEFIY